MREKSPWHHWIEVHKIISETSAFGNGLDSWLTNLLKRDAVLEKAFRKRECDKIEKMAPKTYRQDFAWQWHDARLQDAIDAIDYFDSLEEN